MLGSPTDHDTCMCEFTNIHTSQLDNDGLVFANCDCNTITTVTTFRPKSPKYAKHTTAKYPSGGPWGPADNISYRGFGIRLKGSAQNSKGNCRQNTFINIQPGQAGILAEVNDTGTNTTKNVILLQNDGNAGFDAHPETECAKISVAGGNGDFLGVVKPALDGVEGIGEIEILDPGTGYTGSPVVTFSAPNNVRVPSAARVTAAATAHTDGVSKITVTAMGSGYAANPTVTISGGGGTGAVAIPHVSGGGYLTRIEITNPGAGYTSAPTITISEGGGSGATATARIDGISYFTITNTGHGYRPAHLVVQNAFSSGPAQPTVMPDPRQPWVSQFVWAEQMQAQHSGESLRLYSGGNESSANQLRLVCNSDSASYEQDVDWKINASNNGDMNIVRMGGSGKLNLPWQLKYAGLDVSVGADDSGGTGYAVLRIPNI